MKRTDISVIAVKNRLVTVHPLGDVRESLDYAQTKLFALHLSGNGDIFDVPDAAQST
jgi:hypothetical protein